MKFGIIGTGSVAQAIGGKLMDAGHDVVFGTRNVEATLGRSDSDAFGNAPFSVWIQSHADATLTTFREAAAHGEIVINATGGMVSLEALEAAGHENFSGKVLIDVANPLDFSSGFPPSLSVCNTDSLGEQIQRAIPDARVVKTLNTMSAHIMVDPSRVSGDHNIFVAGDDPEAKAQVVSLLNEALGWSRDSILDLGDITMARGTEMLLPIWVRLFGSFGHANFNFHLAMGEAAKA